MPKCNNVTWILGCVMWHWVWRKESTVKKKWHCTLVPTPTRCTIFLHLNVSYRYCL